MKQIKLENILTSSQIIGIQTAHSKGWLQKTNYYKSNSWAYYMSEGGIRIGNGYFYNDRTINYYTLPQIVENLKPQEEARKYFSFRSEIELFIWLAGKDINPEIKEEKKKEISSYNQWVKSNFEFIK